MSMSCGELNPPTNSEDVERKPMSKELLDAVSTDETFDALYMVRVVLDLFSVWLSVLQI
jgi:hypothetical protein